MSASAPQLLVIGRSSPMPEVCPYPTTYQRRKSPRTNDRNRLLHHPRPSLHCHRRHERCLRRDHHPNPHPYPHQTPSPVASQDNPHRHVLLWCLHHALHHPSRLLLPQIPDNAQHRPRLGKSRVLCRCYRCLITGDQAIVPEHSVDRVE